MGAEARQGIELVAVVTELEFKIVAINLRVVSCVVSKIGKQSKITEDDRQTKPNLKGGTNQIARMNVHYWKRNAWIL